MNLTSLIIAKLEYKEISLHLLSKIFSKLHFRYGSLICIVNFQIVKKLVILLSKKRTKLQPERLKVEWDTCPPNILRNPAFCFEKQSVSAFNSTAHYGRI